MNWGHSRIVQAIEIKLVLAHDVETLDFSTRDRFRTADAQLVRGNGEGFYVMGQDINDL